MPQRKTWMNRGDKQLERGNGLKPVSDRRRDRLAERHAAVAEARTLHGTACALHYRGGCFGGVVGHELIKRSAWADGIYHPPNILPLCAYHNGWVEDEPLAARKIGVAISGFAPVDDVTFEMAAERRDIARRLWPRLP